MPNHVRRLLGDDAVDEIEAAVGNAIAAGSHLDDATTSAAVRELLLAMLAAVIISPTGGADQRVAHDAGRLEAIVSAALSKAAA